MKKEIISPVRPDKYLIDANGFPTYEMENSMGMITVIEMTMEDAEKKYGDIYRLKCKDFIIL